MVKVCKGTSKRVDVESRCLVVIGVVIGSGSSGLRHPSAVFTEEVRNQSIALERENVTMFSSYLKINPCFQLINRISNMYSDQ